VIQVPEGVQAGDTIHVSIPKPQHVVVAVAHAVAVGQAGVQYTSVQGFAAPPPGQSISLQVASAQDLAYAEKLLRARAWVSCFALLDMFLVVMSIFSSLSWWGLLLMIGPLYGYYGARSLKRFHVLIYAVFKLFQCVLYAAAVASATTSGQVLWALVLALCEVYISWEVVKFYKMLQALDGDALVRAMAELHQHQQARVY
jgi:hypothetical protein